MAWPGTLLLVGCGKMGGALLRGWVGNGMPPSGISVLDPHLDDEMATFCRERGIGLNIPTEAPDALVMAVKPQAFAAVAGSVAPLAGPQTLVVSILAGITLATLRADLPAAAAIVRAMPNLAAAVGEGASGLAAEAALSQPQRAVATTLMSSVGLAEWVEESLIDAVTGVSGSGPAYVFLMVEALADAGLAAGLPRDVALRLARATVEGAGALLRADPRSATALREAVTSPGGTTAAALEVLREADGLEALMLRAVAAAVRRSHELAGTSDTNFARRR